MSDIESIKQLRERTHASLMDCRQALEDAGGNVERAFELLGERGSLRAQKLADREATAVRIGSYVHHDGTTGAMVKVATTTDFVARSIPIITFADELALQVVANQVSQIEALLQAPWLGRDGMTIDDVRALHSVAVGENVVIIEAALF